MIVPSARTARLRLAPSIDPTGSPIPTGPADSVATSRLAVSPLIRMSLNGQTPNALASRPAYRKLVQRACAKRSWLARMLVTLLYLALCRK